MADSNRSRWSWALVLALGVAAWADHATGWVEPAFDFVAHQFYEVPILAKLRRPTQLPLVRMHLAVGATLAAAGLLAGPWLGRHGMRWWAVFCVGYAVRAVIWIVGGNLPLVPGDGCHYLEVASSIGRGEGPVKHYVESFFIDYPAIREGRGVLDDWATPLYAYLLAGAFRVVGIEPGRSLEETVAVAKGTSFVLNLLGLPALYGFGRRRYGPEVGLGAMAVLAILPVHALYAGFVLRESLVALTSILAVWTLTEVWHADSVARWAWAVVAGLLGGLAILARDTALALLGAAALYGLLAHGRRRLGPMLVWGATLLAVIAPWAWATNREYGAPFYTYTRYFQYTFSWTVHHDRQGIPDAAGFYTRANAPEIVRIKIKSSLIIAIYSTMILGPPLVLGFARRLFRPDLESEAAPEGRDTDRLVATLGAVFALATLVRVADVTQVAQLGRYYLPLYALALPTAVAGLREAAGDWVAPRARPWLAALLVPMLWSDPTWAYDATWLVNSYQLRWPALRAAGDWVRAHPELVPDDARIMTWFPWEFRLASQRPTILLSRSLELRRLDETIRQYGVTHVLWGSFELPPDTDPESLGSDLERLRVAAGLTNRRELYHSPSRTRYPLRLYRLPGGTP